MSKRYSTTIDVNGVLLGRPEGADIWAPFELIPPDYLSAYDEACERFADPNWGCNTGIGGFTLMERMDALRQT